MRLRTLLALMFSLLLAFTAAVAAAPTAQAQSPDGFTTESRSVVAGLLFSAAASAVR